MVSDFDHEDHKCLFGLVDSTGHIPSSNFLPSLETGTGSSPFTGGIGTSIWGEGPRLVQGSPRGFGAEGQGPAEATGSPRALSQDKAGTGRPGVPGQGKGTPEWSTGRDSDLSTGLPAQAEYAAVPEEDLFLGAGLGAA